LRSSVAQQSAKRLLGEHIFYYQKNEKIVIILQKLPGRLSVKMKNFS